MYQNALEGIAEPRGGVASANRHAGGNTESPFVSWTTDYEGVALAESQTRNGPGVVMRIPQRRWHIVPTRFRNHVFLSRG